MLEVNLEKFWEDDELAHKENCFGPEAPQAAMGIKMSGECVFAELGLKDRAWITIPPEERIGLNKRYNDKSEKIVGKRLLGETLPSQGEQFPYVKRIGEVFGGRYVINDNSEWLESSCDSPKELESLLNKIEKMDLKEFILPDNWEKEKKRIYNDYGRKPGLWRHVRGPVTLATSIYGIENLVYLMMDAPELTSRFFNVIGDTICGIASIMDNEAGFAPGEAPGGFGFADDNCYLLAPEMYEAYGYPVLKRVFDRFSLLPGDERYQHSDSAMEHLLPILARLNLTGCNFGPTVLFDKIRKHMPKTRVDGCLAPFTFMNNDEEAIIKEVKRDCEMAKATRGLNLSTAGSINNGSLLTSMRAVMFAIQNYGRY